MARIEIDPNYTTPTFSRATAGTDLFKKEDVQALAAAVSTHTHATGKGAVLEAGSVPTGLITSAMLADGTIATGDLADGAVTTPKLADAAVTQAKLAANVVLPVSTNLLTNGGFEIWQRGNGPFTGAVWSADRWIQSITGSDTVSTSRDAANVDSGSQYCAAITYTRVTGGSIVAQANPEYLTPFKGKTVSFSIRVKTSTANAVRVRVSDGVAPTLGTYHTGSGAYETLTLTAVISASATIISTGLIFDQSCMAYIDNAMLVVGSVAVQYAPLHPADDLARCQRYYEILGESTSSLMVAGYNTGGAATYTTMSYKQRKAVVPTVTRVGTWSLINCTGPSADVPGLDQCRLVIATTATGYAYANNINTGNGFTVEANP